MIAAIISFLGGTIGVVRLIALVTPLLYIFYTINDYKSQAVTISEQKASIESLSKQVSNWESRYVRINDKRAEYKLLLDKYDEATKNAGCFAKVQQQLKILTDTKWRTDALTGGSGGGG